MLATKKLLVTKQILREHLIEALPNTEAGRGGVQRRILGKCLYTYNPKIGEVQGNILSMQPPLRSQVNLVSPSTGTVFSVHL